MLRLTLVVCLALGIYAKNPGYKIRVTQNGVNYAANAAGGIVGKLIEKLTIPPISFDEHSININLHGIKVTSFTDAQWAVALQPSNTVVLRMSNAKLGAAGQFTGKVILSKADGTLTASASGTKLSVAAALGTDANGRPTVTETSCSASMDNFDIKMHGTSMVNFLNLFHKLIANSVKPTILNALCSEVKTEVNTNLAKVLSTLPASITIYKDFSVDYRFIGAPVVTSDYIEIQGRGEIDFQGKNTDPFDAPPMDTSSSGDTLMAYFWGSQYILDSAAYQLQQANVLNLLVNKDTVPAAKDLLATTCAALCVGTIVKEIGEDYPNTYTQLNLQSKSVPQIAISSSGAVLTASASVDLGVDNTTLGRYENVAGANLDVTADVAPALDGQNITGKVTITKLDLTGTYDYLEGPVNWDFLGRLAQNILQNEINNLLKKGIPIPTIDGLSFVSPYLALKEKTIEVATNLQYTPTL